MSRERGIIKSAWFNLPISEYNSLWLDFLVSKIVSICFDQLLYLSSDKCIFNSLVFRSHPKNIWVSVREPLARNCDNDIMLCLRTGSSSSRGLVSFSGTPGKSGPIAMLSFWDSR